MTSDSTASVALMLAAALAIGGFPGRVGASDLVIRNVRLVDLAAGPREPSEPTDVAIRGGRIAELGAARSAEDVPVLDTGGGYLLPGLVDAHVHLGWGSGSAIG